MNYGTATITATAEDGGLQAKCEVIVFKPVTSVAFEQTTMQMQINTMQPLVQAKVLPEDATNKNITYTSSNPSVVTINPDNQLMMAFALGTSTITATTEDGELTATCEIEVVSNISTEIESHNVAVDILVQKIFENNTIYILCNGEKYTIDGRRVE